MSGGIIPGIAANGYATFTVKPIDGLPTGTHTATVTVSGGEEITARSFGVSFTVVESMHWLLDVHFTEDKTRVWDMNVQKILNTTRKIALNMVRLFKSASRPERLPLTSVFKENLFDIGQFAAFLDFFCSASKLD